MPIACGLIIMHIFCLVISTMNLLVETTLQATWGTCLHTLQVRLVQPGQWKTVASYALGPAEDALCVKALQLKNSTSGHCGQWLLSECCCSRLPCISHAVECCIGLYWPSLVLLSFDHAFQTALDM